ncbi:PAS domain S-box-containing protein [Methanohalophilus levihalophilus]|uniref:PAS domain-containing protein n=1 Tax=Methanohalophilus levihalophilus TaxID=1431282 RepID=UPI001AEA5E28|nr:PAS domain-containing protein [Methanohalophilus levihalophilus]MBP2029340.1 PAS domain S-box-containing protein [Methanohalophilus levihalophilus]
MTKNMQGSSYENPVVVFLWKAEKGWPVEFVSENIRQFGYSPDDFTKGHRKYASIVHPDDLERLRKSLADICETNLKDYTHCYRIVTPSGESRRVLEKTLIERDSNGTITHFQGFVIDITDQTDEIEDFSDFILTTEPVAIFVWKAEKGWPVEYVSEDIQYFGYTPEDFLSGSINYADIIHPEDLPRIEEQLEKQTDSGEEDFYQEYRIYSKSGELRNVAERTLIIRDKNRKAISYQGIIEKI